jgi:hypothetical protein
MKMTLGRHAEAWFASREKGTETNLEFLFSELNESSMSLFLVLPEIASSLPSELSPHPYKCDRTQEMIPRKADRKSSH